MKKLKYPVGFNLVQGQKCYEFSKEHLLLQWKVHKMI